MEQFQGCVFSEVIQEIKKEPIKGRGGCAMAQVWVEFGLGGMGLSPNETKKTQ